MLMLLLLIMAVQSRVGVKGIVFGAVADLDTVPFGNVNAPVVGKDEYVYFVNNSIIYQTKYHLILHLEKN